MKYLILIAAAILLTAGCSKDEPAPAAEDHTAADAEVAAENAADTSDQETAAEDDASTEEAVEVVEESSGADTGATDEPIVLAQADTSAPAQSWKYREGSNFTRLVPTQPTVGGPDKIEVAEVFMYGCPHCYDLESYMNEWEANKDPNVRFERIPAIFNNVARMHAQLYYTEEVLAQNGQLKDRNAFREMVFNEFHRRRNQLASIESIQRVFERAGIDKETFERTWNSFEVNQKMRVGADLVRRYGIVSVPMIVVNGKYRADTGSAGGYPQLIELIDELTVREGLR